MNRIRASRYLLGFCLFTRAAGWITIAMSIVIALIPVALLICGKPPHALTFLGYGGVLAVCALVLLWCEKDMLDKYRRGTLP